jgi:hypothetical protein
MSGFAFFFTQFTTLITGMLGAALCLVGCSCNCPHENDDIKLDGVGQNGLSILKP